MENSSDNHIPDGEILFRYCNPKAFPEGQDKIPAGIFSDRELSCDWKKFRQDPMTSFHINEGKTCVICINVCDSIKNPINPKRTGQKVPEWKQEIIHSPVTAFEDKKHGANQAHSLIKGLKKLPVCLAIAENSSLYNNT